MNTLDMVRQGASAARQLRQQRRANVLSQSAFRTLMNRIADGLSQSLNPEQPGLQAVRELRYQARYDVLTGAAFDRFMDEIDAAFAQMLGRDPAAEPPAAAAEPGLRGRRGVVVIDDPIAAPPARRRSLWARLWAALLPAETDEQWMDRQW